MRSIWSKITACALLLATVIPFPSYAQHGLATPFDWQDKWGTIKPDTGINSDLHDIKHAINAAIDRCGIGKTNYDLIKVYTTPVSGITAYLVDASAYFAQGQSATCDAKPCESGEGCVLDVMGPETISTRNVACKTGTCSVKVYNYPMINESYVLSWKVMSTAEFMAIREARKDKSGTKFKYSAPVEAFGNVLSYQLATGCVLDEMDINNDGRISNDETCTKYYQYSGSLLIDLFQPEEPEPIVENDTRFQPKPVYQAWWGKDAATAHDAYDRSVAAVTGIDGNVTTIDDVVYKKVWREGPRPTDGEHPFGDTYTDPYRVSPGATQAYQFGPFTFDKEKSTQTVKDFVCDVYTNKAGAKNAVFVPTATDPEYQSFRDAVIKETVPGMTHAECERNFTKWVGITDCARVNPPCNGVITITATRQCQRSSSAYGECGECSGAPDTQPINHSVTKTDGKVIPSWPLNTCVFKALCRGPACPAGGTDCLAAHAKVLMADGSYKTLETLGLGDKIMGFRKDAPLAALVPATVTDITATPVEHSKRALYEVNGVPLTSGHKVLTAKGTLVSASNLRAGNKVVGLSGNAVKVEKAARNKGESEKVYSITLDGADGFVVNGMRLLSK